MFLKSFPIQWLVREAGRCFDIKINSRRRDACSVSQPTTWRRFHRALESMVVSRNLSTHTHARCTTKRYSDTPGIMTLIEPKSRAHNLPIVSIVVVPFSGP